MRVIETKKEWNDLMLASDASFLQSWEWGELQKKMERSVKRVVGEGFAGTFVRYALPLGKSYLYSPRGPIFFNPEEGVSKEILETAEIFESKPIFLKIEPDFKKGMGKEILEKSGFLSAKPVQPRQTLILDLDKSEEELLKGMEHDTRYSIRAAEKRGVTVSKNGAFEDFWRLFKETNKRHRLQNYPKKYYEEVFSLSGDCRTEVIAATLEGRVISAAVIVFWNKTAHYLYAASASGYGKFNAPTLVLWNAIRNAKNEGFKTFDFWGISHENKAWSGITAFKKSFGGREVNYAGAWDLPLDRKWFCVYKFAKRFF